MTVLSLFKKFYLGFTLLLTMLMGYFARVESLHVTSGLYYSLRESENLENRCSIGRIREDDLDWRVIVIYIAIEDYNRPAWIRQLEFIIAKVAAFWGMQPIKTIGIGQVSLTSFISAFPAYREFAFRQQLAAWIRQLTDDCNSVEIIKLLISNIYHENDKKNQEEDLLQKICFLHTGYSDQCVHDIRHRRYVYAA